MMHTKLLYFNTVPNRVNFYSLKQEIEKFIGDIHLDNGILLIQSMHTTCSVFFEEGVHDCDEFGYDYLQRDLIRGLNKIYPKQLMFDDYYDYPGHEHRDFCRERYSCYRDHPAILLNADAHLKATLTGSQVCIAVVNGKCMMGEFGDIFFADWDTNRSRTRSCLLCLIGE